MPDNTQDRTTRLLAEWGDEPTHRDPTPEEEAEAIRQLQEQRQPAAPVLTDEQYKLYYGVAPPKPKPIKAAVVEPPSRVVRTRGQRLTEDQEHYILTSPKSINKKAKELGVPRQTIQGVMRRARELQEGVNLTHRCRHCHTLLVCPECGGTHEL